MTSWFAVVTYPEKEIEAAKGLRMRGYSVCLPLRQMRRSFRRDRRSIVVRTREVWIKGYLFIRIGAEQSIYEVNNAPLVSRVVLVGDEPAPISDQEIDDLRTHLRSIGKNPIMVAQKLYKPGEPVEFIDGPYIGYQGTVIVDTGTKIRISSPKISANPVVVSKRHYVKLRQDSARVA